MNIFSKTLTTFFIVTCVMTAPIFAQNNTTTTTSKEISKKIATKNKVANSKSINSKKNPIVSNVPALESEPDTKLSSSLEYKCELGISLILYKQENNDQFVDVKWKNHLYHLNRVTTSTGANRYENEKAGLVWINIPAKGLLLDSIKGRQLANECKANQSSFIS